MEVSIRLEKKDGFLADHLFVVEPTAADNETLERDGYFLFSKMERTDGRPEYHYVRP